MRIPVRTIVVVAAIVVAAFAFHRGSGRVLHWLAAMHGGAGQAVHGSR